MHDVLEKAARYFLTCPDWHAVRPRDIGAAVLPHIFTTTIERDRDGKAIALPIRFTGTALDRTFGRPLVGIRLNDFIHGPRGADVIAGFLSAANEKKAIWMRQVVRLPADAPRFVEGVVVPLEPDRLYGALMIGSLADRQAPAGFEIKEIGRPALDRAPHQAEALAGAE